ncbi:hypothetical protein KIU71_02390 [Alteromonas sp. SM 2104]|nr:hypothetical protein [Alteromonas oceanisediminis]
MLVISLIGISSAVAKQQTIQAALPALPAAQQTFFNHLSSLCGQAFAGKVTVDTPKSDGFDDTLIMHISDCSESVIRIPFHVGEDRSRTWVLSNVGGNLMLKHDHRHADGSEDALTQYGGVATTVGWPSVQSFPADTFTQTMFVEQHIPQSNDNTWQMLIDEKTFSYRLVRPAREFRVDFDLSKPQPTPPPAWGSQ